jgi:hypothetical protein
MHLCCVESTELDCHPPLTPLNSDKRTLNKLLEAFVSTKKIVRAES